MTFCGRFHQKKNKKIWWVKRFALLLHTELLQCIWLMETTVVRKPASFSLRSDLLEGLRRNAKRENRTLNNYVESVLLDIVYNEPNRVTEAAIEEARSGRNSNKVYSSVEELFKDLDAEEE